MKELIKISSIIGLGKVINIVIGIVRLKISAIFLAPFGMGIVSQISTFHSLLGRVVDLGIGAGVTKYVAEYQSQNDQKRLNRLISTSVFGFAIMGVIVVIIVSFWSSYFAILLLNDSSFYLLVIMAAIAVAIRTQIQILERTLQGLLKMREMVNLSIFSAVVSICVSIPLIIFFNVYGAIISLVLSNLIIIFFAQIYIQRLLKGEFQLRIRYSLIDKNIISDLLKFGGANSTVFISTTITLLLIRSIIIKDLGAESNGLYQVAVGVASQYIGLIAVATWQYGMPKVATMIGKKKEIQLLQNDVTRLNLLILTPIILFLLLTREIWIPLLFSQSFIGAYSLIGWQMIGELIRSIKWGPNMVNQPYERYRFIILQSIFTAISFLGFFFFLFPIYGLVAAPMSYAFSQVFMLIFALSGHYYYDRFFFKKEIIVLSILSVVIVCLITYINNDIGTSGLEIYLLALILLIIWFLINVKPNERVLMLQWLKRYIP